MKAIQVAAAGGPEVLEYRELEVPQPGAGEARVRVEAIGVNYIDVYHRAGVYKLPTPFVPGSEGAGVIDALGENVSGLAVGDRVAWAMSLGAYAEYAVVPVSRLVPLPRNVDARTGAAAMLQGMTAHYLVNSTHPLKSGQSVLVHAAAGGVGGLLVQMSKQRGARVFATASTSKLERVKDEGADVVIDYTTADFESEVLAQTDGAGVNAVYDGVGRSTFDGSLNCVGTRGVLALYGQASGAVPPVDPSRLAKRGIFLTRPSLAHYIGTREELEWRSREVLEAIGSGALRLRIDRELPLRDAAEAHRLLESRGTSGKLLLIP